MNELDRRSLLKAITAVPLAYCKALSVPSQEPVSVVASHTDRTPDIRIKPPALVATWISKS